MIDWEEGDCFDIGLIFNALDKLVNLVERGQFLEGEGVSSSWRNHGNN